MPSRQFFVGGNFKMNPLNRKTKEEIIANLNKAALEPSVGPSLLLIYYRLFKPSFL